METIQVKALLTLLVDADEYIVPSDGDVTEEIKEAIREYFHDISGIKVKGLRVSQEILHE